MDKVSIAASLQQSPLFSGLNQSQLEAIAKKAKVRQFFANDCIVYQGEPSTALFMMVNGIVVVKSVVRGKENVLAYLMPGNTFGEVGILENQTRSASIVALSEVDVLVIQRDDFLEILHAHSNVAIELARILGRYLVQSSRRLSSENAETRLILLISTDGHIGGTTLSTLVAERLVRVLKASVAYLEYPNPWKALQGYPLPKGSDRYHHAEGYDMLFPPEEGYLNASTRTTLILDRLHGAYDMVVVHLQDSSDDSLVQWAEQADQIILMSPDTPDGLRDLERCTRVLKSHIRPDETSVISVINAGPVPAMAGRRPEESDYYLPHISEFPTFAIPQRAHDHVPEVMDAFFMNCVQRLERNQSISIFIPTTTDARNHTDTTPQMDRTVQFMADRFGGATVREVNGVWKSDKLGLIGERIFVVYSYLTRSDLSRHLDEVIEFIKTLKRELRQEAMALEINQRLTLI